MSTSDLEIPQQIAIYGQILVTPEVWKMFNGALSYQSRLVYIKC